MRRYLALVGGESSADRVQGVQAPDGEALVEFGGRLCYRSWEPGLNANVTKVREDSMEYLGNILKSGHGSVTEHANFSFVLHNISRVLTHEIVRHRAGAAYSQESMRFVRLTDIPFWFPEWARLGDTELMERSVVLLHAMEDHQTWMADHFDLDAMKRCPDCQGKGKVWVPARDAGVDEPNNGFERPCMKCEGSGEVSKVPFSEKKHKTSFMRRFAPDGVSTGILCTFNIRTIRHIVYMRTALGAEEEIRLVADDIARLAEEAFPNLMQDYAVNEYQEWVPDFIKV